MKKLLTLVAVVATAGLIMAWGCGGKAVLGTGTEEVSGAPVPFVITAGLNGGRTADDLTKDITAWGDFGSEGMIETQGESAGAVDCWFTWEADTAIGVRPVINLVTKGKVYNECFTAGKDPNNCIGCMNDENPLTPESANLYCEGIVPPGVSDQIDAVAHCKFTFNVDDFTVAKARVIERGWRTVYTMVGWPELDQLIYAGVPMTSIMDNILLNNLLLGSQWDFSLADGNPATETTMSAASDPVRDVPTLPGGPGVEKFWVKYLSFTEKGSGPEQTIIDTRDIVTPVQFAVGSTPGSTYAWDKDRVYLSQTFCTNIDEGCDIPDFPSPPSDVLSITGVDGLPLMSNTTRDFSVITIDYLGTPLLAQMTEANYTLELEDPLPMEDAIATLRTYDDDLEEAYIAITDAYKFQREEFYAIARNVMVTIGGQRLALRSPYVLENLTMACAGSDVFKVDSLSACYGDFNALNLISGVTLAEALAADLIVHVPDATLLDPELGKIAFDSSKFSGGDTIFSFGKPLVKQTSAGVSSYMTTAFDSIVGFDSFNNITAGNRDSIYVMLYDNANNVGVGYGIDAYDHPGDVHITDHQASGQYVANATYSIAITVNNTNEDPVSCDLSSISVDQCLDLIAAELETNALIADAVPEYNKDELRVTGADEGTTLTIVMVATSAGNPDITYAQVTVQAPVVPGMRTYVVGFAYDRAAAFRKFTSGARLEINQASVSVRLVTGKNNADMNVQALIGGQWQNITTENNPNSIAFDKHFPQDPNSPVDKALTVPALNANSTSMVIFFSSLDADTLVDILDNIMVNYYIVDQVVGPYQMGFDF